MNYLATIAFVVVVVVVVVVITELFCVVDEGVISKIVVLFIPAVSPR